MVEGLLHPGFMVAAMGTSRCCVQCGRRGCCLQCSTAHRQATKITKAEMGSAMQAGDSYVEPPEIRALFRNDAEPEFIGFADDGNLIPSSGNCPVPE